jgi:hypothetical protein
MTNQLFWIIHFVKYVSTCIDGISPFNQHLLILDGRGSHVTSKIVHQAKKVCLALLTLLTQTSLHMNTNLRMQMCSSHSNLHFASFETFGAWLINTNFQI